MARDFEKLMADSGEKPFATVRGLVPEVERYHVHQGKVRDTIDLEDGTLLMIATDRISAFDVVLPTLIPGKGIILTQMTVGWSEVLKTQNHLISPYIPN